MDKNATRFLSLTVGQKSDQLDFLANENIAVFPEYEISGSTSQLRRAIVYVPASHSDFDSYRN
jgi:hypothetical protein